MENFVATCGSGPYLLWTPSEWAAWVQAIFSVIAILVAVAVARYQAETELKRTLDAGRDELRGLLLSLRSEMHANMELLENNVGPVIRAKEPGKPFDITFPLPEDPFHVYNALLPKLGTIIDDDLRNQIVRTYSLAKGFVQTIRFNNEMLRDFESALEKAEAGNAHAEEILARRQFVLTAYGDPLQAQYRQVLEEANSLATKLAQI